MTPKNRLIRLLNDGRVSYYDHGKYLLTWNVKMHHTPTTETILNCVAVNFYKHRGELLIRFPEAEDIVEEKLHDDNTFGFVLESMRHSFEDGDTYRMYRPKFAKKYGLAYEGKGADSPFDVEFCYLGRSGGYLAIEAFEGIRMKDFDYDDWYPDQWTRQLCAMIEEWDLCLTRESIYAEFDYQLAWLVNQELEGLEEAA